MNSQTTDLVKRDQPQALCVNGSPWQPRPPATVDEVIDAVAPSLALVAPAGFSAEDRLEWLAVAAQTVASFGMSADVLREAVEAARRDPQCDHPAKIIPAISRYLGPDWQPIRVVERAEPQFVPVAVIEAPNETIPLDEIRQMSPRFRRMGLEKGWITQDQIDALGDDQ